MAPPIPDLEIDPGTTTDARGAQGSAATCRYASCVDGSRDVLRCLTPLTSAVHELALRQRLREAKIPSIQRLRAMPSLAVVTAIAALAGCGGSDEKPATAQKPSASVSGNQRSILATV